MCIFQSAQTHCMTDWLGNRAAGAADTHLSLMKLAKPVLLCINKLWLFCDTGTLMLQSVSLRALGALMQLENTQIQTRRRAFGDMTIDPLDV